MINRINIKICIAITFILLSIQAVYATNETIEFFSSNNTKEIDLQTAYQRLISKAQLNLQNDTITILQTNHMEQGKFEEVLGTYKMSTNQKITADNTEVFHTSPLQVISNDQAFTLASQLANALNQDSIAIFIPNNQMPIGDIIVNFTSNKPSINNTLKMINRRLPASYSQAFSLYLSNTHAGFQHATVKKIEWLGSSNNIIDIKHAFPNEEVTSQNGTAYLAYQDGRIEQL